MSSLRYRPGLAGDLSLAKPFLEAERGCFSQHVWDNLPGLLTGLLSRRAAKSYIVEDRAKSRISWFGLTAFVDPDAARCALEDGSIPFRESLFQSALRTRRVFLDPGEIAEANRCKTLVL